jgi:hypothetical protein
VASGGDPPRCSKRQRHSALRISLAVDAISMSSVADGSSSSTSGTSLDRHSTLDVPCVIAEVMRSPSAKYRIG